jgi:hypothetical protein
MGGSGDDATRTRISQSDIDDGRYSVPELVYLGRNLAIRNWQISDGFGNANTGAAPSINRLPGPDSTSCMSCHGLGNGIVLGPGDVGGNVLVTLDDAMNPTLGGSNERNTPAIHGLVLLELLAKEISIDLRGQRDGAIEDAMESGEDVKIDLSSKGISYGTLTARPDGTVDTAGVNGIDSDLRVRPFHAKGHEATIRIFTRGALNRHHAIQATEFLQFSMPDLDPETADPDGDGIVNEVSEGDLTAMTVFQVGMPIPQEVDQERASISNGRALMESLGCTSCHVPTLRLDDPTWRYTSSNGNTLEIDLTDSSILGAGRPMAEEDGSVLVQMWGDLKRHDLGEESHEPLDQPVDLSRPNYELGTVADRIDEVLPPIDRELMMTTELWGLRDTGPWWHDGSSDSIEDSILRHGGDARIQRDAYFASTIKEKSDLLAFLRSLQVAAIGEVLVTADPDSNSVQ